MSIFILLTKVLTTITEKVWKMGIKVKNIDLIAMKKHLREKGEFEAIKCIELQQESYERFNLLFKDLMRRYIAVIKETKVTVVSTGEKNGLKIYKVIKNDN